MAPSLPSSSRYVRQTPSKRLDKTGRQKLLADYFAHYRSIAASNPTLLNQKLPREAFEEILETIGSALWEWTKIRSTQPGPVNDFLEINQLPPSLAEMLPADFRAFCLGLNALKQWVSAEQQATDRYLLGANARSELRTAAASCVLTAQGFDDGCELHHPVRDGRPPLPLSREAHSQIEAQQTRTAASNDPKFAQIAQIRRETRNSWVNLRKGCLDLSGEVVQYGSASVRTSAQSFARKVSAQTGCSFDQIIALLDENDLGSE